MKIGCALSTISTRWEKIEWDTLCDSFDIIYLLHQKPVPIPQLPSKVIHIPLNSIGLTKSRNAGIEIADCDFLFISDDDTKYKKDKVQEIARRMQLSPDISVGIGQIQTPDGSAYKKYRILEGTSTWRSLLAISSIEIVVRPDRIHDAQVSFCEDFGLGTTLPCGEEAIFINDCMQKGLKCRHFNIPFVIHDAESSTTAITKSILLARILMFQKIYGKLIGTIFSIYYLLRTGLKITGRACTKHFFNF